MKHFIDSETGPCAMENVWKDAYVVNLEKLSNGIHCISALPFDYTNDIVEDANLSAPFRHLTSEK